MTDWWKAGLLATATAALLGCSGNTDVSNVSLAGTWIAAPNLLGIATIDVTFTEGGGNVDGTGTFVGIAGALASGTLTATGVHIASELNITFHLSPEGGAPLTQNLTGHVDDNDHFELVFPGDEAKSVTFTRQ